jgi:hypothetical protein
MAILSTPPRFEDTTPLEDEAPPRFQDTMPMEDGAPPRLEDTMPMEGDAPPRFEDTTPVEAEPYTSLRQSHWYDRALRRTRDTAERAVELPGRLAQTFTPRPELPAADEVGVVANLRRGAAEMAADMDLASDVDWRRPDMWKPALERRKSTATAWDEKTVPRDGLLGVLDSAARSGAGMGYSTALEVTGKAVPGLGPLLSWSAWQKQGRGQFLASALEDIDPDTLSDSSRRKIDTGASWAGAAYATVEYSTRLMGGAIGRKIGLTSIADKLSRLLPDQMTNLLTSKLDDGAWKWVSKQVAKYALNVVGESAEEIPQTAIEKVFGNVTKAVANKDMPAEQRLELERVLPILKESVMAGVQAIPSMMVLGAASGAGNAVADKRDLARRRAAAQPPAPAAAGNEPAPAPVPQEEQIPDALPEPPGWQDPAAPAPAVAVQAEGQPLSVAAQEDAEPKPPQSGEAVSPTLAQGPEERPASEAGAISEPPAAAAAAAAATEPDATPTLGRAPTLAEAQPGNIVENVPMEELAVDPDRFQYKMNPGHHGQTGSLQGVKAWNRDIAGLVLAWRDPADRKVYVVNGHNRYAKAADLGVKGLDVRLITAENDKQARAIGALANIAEGKGTAVDAAKFMRESQLTAQEMESSGVSRAARMVQDGEALVPLADELFRRVVNGEWSVERGKAVAAAGTPAKQRALAELIGLQEKSRGSRLPDDVVQELAQEVEAAPVVTTTEMDLFGSTVQEQSAAVEKAWLTARIRRDFSAQKSLFGKVAVSRNAARLEQAGNKLEVGHNAELRTDAAQMLEMFGELKKFNPVSGILNRGAERIAGGENERTVTKESIEAVRTAIRAAIGGRQGSGVQGASAGATPGQPAAGAAGGAGAAGAVGPDSRVGEAPVGYGTGIRQRLEAVAAARPAGVQVQGEMSTLVTRGLYAKAGALLEATKAGRITEEEAGRRWKVATEEADRTLKQAQRKTVERQRQGNTSRQVEMFDAAPAARGPQMMLLEPAGAEEYVHALGIQGEAGQQAARELSQQWSAVSGASGRAYQFDLFGPASDASPARAVQSEPDAIEEALKNPADPQAWARAFRQSEGQTVSSLVHAKLTRKIPAWNIRGTKINNATDFAATLMVLRSPFFETIKVAYLDADKRVIESRVATVGLLNETQVDASTLVGGMPDETAAVLVAHNHPSGDPSPSPADVRVQRLVSEAFTNISVPILDHVITNGGKYYSMREENLIAFGSPNATPASPLRRSEYRRPPEMVEQADWERVKRADLAHVGGSDAFAPIVKALRQGDPDHGHIIFVTARNAVTAVQRIDVSAPATESWPKIMRTAANEGAKAFLVDWPQPSGTQVVGALSTLQAFGSQAEIRMLDAATLDVPSARETGLFIFNEAPAAYGTVREDAAAGDGGDTPGTEPKGETNEWPGGPLGDPAVPTAGIRVEDDPDFSVFPIELPEAVEFGRRLMGGLVPKVRKSIGDALGRFRYRPGDAALGIELRADIFRLVTPEETARMVAEAKEYALAEAPADPVEQGRIASERAQFLIATAREKALKENPRLASKVVWHELGHLTDFLPEKMVDGRGNILGRISSFVSYAKTMLGAVPENQEAVLTPEDRKKLRRQAEKETGARPPKDEEAEVSAWQQEVSRRYKEIVVEEAARRGLVTRADLLEELQPLIAWWRGSGETMEDYFKAPEEMYAEAISALMNNPAAVMKRAPTFYKMFYSWYRNKPEVRAQYNQIQDDIRKGRLHDQHEERLRNMMRAGDENAALVDTQKSQLTRPELVDAVVWAFDRRFGPWQRRLERMGAGGEEALGALSANLYKGSATELLAARVSGDVVGRLVGENMTWEDLGLYGIYQRVRLERTDIANPTGLTPKRATELLEKMRKDLGPARFATLEESWLWYRTIVEQEVLGKARQWGVFGAELQDHLDQNVAYMTFSVTPDRSMAEGEDAFRSLLEKRYGTNEGAAIYRQIGTLKGVSNPATATLMKMASLSNLVYREHAKWEAIQALLSDSDLAGEWRPADTQWDRNTNRRKIIDSRSDRVGTLRVMHGGEVHAFYGPKALVSAFDSVNALELSLLSRALRVFGHLPMQLKRLYTELNPGFWTRQYRRDIRRFNRTMPGTSRDVSSWIPGLAELGELPLVGPRMIGRVPGVGGPFGRHAKRAGEAAMSSMLGQPNADAQDALRRGAWISRPSGYQGIREGSEAMERFLLRRGVDVPDQGRVNEGRVARVMRAAGRLWNAGQYYERKVKMAGLLWMDEKHPNMPEDRKLAYVRTLSGSPDFLEKGAANEFVEFARLFYNPWKEGLRSEKRAWMGGGLIEGRKGEMALNLMRFSVLPRLALLAAGSGAFAALKRRPGDDDEPEGDELQDMLQSIPQNDRRAYWVVPLGWADRLQKKATYLRLPLEENERMVVAVVDAMFDSAVRGVKYPIGQVWNYLGGNVPGTNPMLALAADWATFLRGGNPEDEFRGKPILNQNETGARAWRKMGMHTWNATLGSVIGRMGEKPVWAPQDGAMERFLKLPIVQPTVGSFVRVSNQGRIERLMEYIKPVEEREREMKVKVEEAISAARSGKDIDPATSYMLSRGAWADKAFPGGAPTDEDELARRSYAHLKNVLERIDQAEAGPEVSVFSRSSTRLQKRELVRKLIEED